MSSISFSSSFFNKVQVSVGGENGIKMVQQTPGIRIKGRNLPQRNYVSGNTNVKINKKPALLAEIKNIIAKELQKNNKTAKIVTMDIFLIFFTNSNIFLI